MHKFTKGRAESQIQNQLVSQDEEVNDVDSRILLLII